MILRKQDKNIVFEPALFVSITNEDVLTNGSLLDSEVKGNAGINLGGLIAGVDGNAGVNLGGLVAAVDGVDGNAGVNLGGLVAGVGGNVGVNLGGLVSVVDGNANLNASSAYSKVNRSHDYTIGHILPKITNYLPKCIRRINLPAVNFGAVTNTKNMYNSFVLGVFNNLVDTGDDYLALGLVNRITDKNKKTRYSLFCSGRVHIDGIFGHRDNKNLDAGVREQK